MAVRGGSNKNLFTIPTTGANKVTNNTPTVTSQLLKNKYNVQVNTETKIAQVFLQGTLIARGLLGQGGDISVGTIDLQTGKFTPDANRKLIAETNPPGNAVEAELKYFNSLEGSKQLKEVSSRTVQKSVLDEGGSVEQAKTAAQTLTGVDPGQTGNANTLAQQDPNLNQSLQSGSGETKVTAAENAAGVSNLNSMQIEGSLVTRPVTQYPDNSLLRYPIDMDKTQDHMQFTMLEYRPRKLSPKGISEGKLFEDRPKAENKGEIQTRGKTVVLPIQPSITDLNTVRWGPDEINALEGIAAATAMATIQGGAVGAKRSLEGLTQLIGGNTDTLKNLAAAFFTGEAVQVKGLVPRVLGGILNPNMELLFEGPQLRTFQFNFTLSAREPDESKVIRNIIRFFKQGMSVKRANTDLFLKSPHTFEIKYIYGVTGKDHPWINSIKECALTGCSVNYTPSGSYATFTDGAMTSYEISLQFAELEAIYDDDYKNSGGKGNESEIGY